MVTVLPIISHLGEKGQHCDNNSFCDYYAKLAFKAIHQEHHIPGENGGSLI